MDELLLGANVSIAAAPCLSYVLTQDTPILLFTPLIVQFYSLKVMQCASKKAMRDKGCAVFLSLSFAS